jgi:hypothetical protein
MYGLLIFVWIDDVRRFRGIIQPIHAVCFLAALLKLLEVSLQAAYYEKLDSFGSTNNMPILSIQLTSKLFEAIFLSLMFLTSVGNNLLKLRDIIMFLILLGVLLIVSIFSTLTCAHTEDCKIWFLGGYVVKALVLLAIIVASNFQITYQRQTVSETFGPITPALAAGYKKLESLHYFRWLFFSYLLQPTALEILKVRSFSCMMSRQKLISLCFRRWLL